MEEVAEIYGSLRCKHSTLLYVIYLSISRLTITQNEREFSVFHLKMQKTIMMYTKLKMRIRKRTCSSPQSHFPLCIFVSYLFLFSQKILTRVENKAYGHFCFKKTEWFLLPSKFFYIKICTYLHHHSMFVVGSVCVFVYIRHLQPRGTFSTRTFAAMNTEFLFNGSLFMLTFHMKREVMRNDDNDAAEEY